MFISVEVRTTSPGIRQSRLVGGAVAVDIAEHAGKLRDVFLGQLAVAQLLSKA